MLRTAITAVIFTAGAICVAQADVKTDCASDVKSYCSGVKPEDNKLKDCMAEHRAKLSTACKLAVGERQLELDAETARKRSSSGLAPKAK